jgi:hypothetical protein
MCSSDGRCAIGHKIDVPSSSNPMNPQVEEVVDGWRQDQAVLPINPLFVVGITPELAVELAMARKQVDQEVGHTRDPRVRSGLMADSVFSCSGRQNGRLRTTHPFGRCGSMTV